VPEIPQLNLHREFFGAIASGRKRMEYRRQSRYWRKRLEEQNMTRSYSATVMRKTLRACARGYRQVKCRWNVGVFVATEMAVPHTTPSVLAAYCKSDGGRSGARTVGRNTKSGPIVVVAHKKGPDRG